MQVNRRRKAPWKWGAGEPAPEARLASLVAKAERPACAIDERGVILAANGGLEELVGFEPGELAGRPLSVLSDSRDANLRWDVVEALFKDQRDRHEVKGRCVSHRTGDAIWCRWDFSLVPGGRRNRPQAIAHVEDLTASVHADSHVRILQYLITAAGRADDAGELLHAAVQVICHFTGCGLGLVWLPDGDQLVCSPIGYLHGYGLDGLRRESVGARLAAGEGLAGAAWITNEQALVERAGEAGQSERAWALDRAGALEAIGVPIRTPSGVAAVLELFVTSDRGVSDRISLIGKVAAELGELLDRRRLNDALAVSEERFRSVSDAAVDAIVSADTDGRLLSWNKGAEAMFGWSRDEVIGQPLTVIIPERFHQAHSAGIARVAASGHSTLAGTVIELAAVRRDGTEFPVELSIGMWESAEGRGFSGVIRDITERAQAEAALRVSEERFRSVSEAAVDAIVSADTDGCLLSWNKGAEAMFGWSGEEVIGQPLTDHHPRALPPGPLGRHRPGRRQRPLHPGRHGHRAGRRAPGRHRVPRRALHRHVGIGRGPRLLRRHPRRHRTPGGPGGGRRRGPGGGAHQRRAGDAHLHGVPRPEEPDDLGARLPRLPEARLRPPSWARRAPATSSG